jgi:hypothetical protein
MQPHQDPAGGHADGVIPENTSRVLNGLDVECEAGTEEYHQCPRIVSDAFLPISPTAINKIE